MKLPEPTVTIAKLIDDSMPQDAPRAHLGCSQIGHPCERWLWLSFRWAVVEKFPGRILRLFRRGQNEENTIIADLRRIGIDIRTRQARVDFGHHFSGSIDGLILSGVSEAPNKKHIAEFKTHSKKSFDEVEKKGIPEMHNAQMQCYMLGIGVDRGLYFAVCKDDDRIYTERARLDKDYALKLVEKAKRITMSDNIPAPLSTDPTWYQCKFCAAHDFCHVSHKTEQVNCRTCAHATATPESTWHCSRWDAEVPTDAQREGCRAHVLHPDLVPWKLDQDKSTEWSACYDGTMNGEDGHDSKTMLMLDDKNVRTVVEIFSGTVCS